MSCLVKLYCVMSCHVKLYCVMSCHIKLYCVMSCHVVLYCIDVTDWNNNYYVDYTTDYVLFTAGENVAKNQIEAQFQF